MGYQVVLIERTKDGKVKKTRPDGPVYTARAAAEQLADLHQRAGKEATVEERVK